MKIESSGPVVPPLASTAGGLQAVAAIRPLAPVKALAVAGDSAPASACAQLSSTSGDFDAAKVAAIRQSISAGLYQVNLGQVADGLLASVQELLNTQQP